MKTKHWPTLYKKAKDGKISQWKIWTTGPTIYMSSGFVGMKLSETFDNIKAGKNIGRSNETTREEQAISEAASRFQKRLDLGYNDDIVGAQEGVRNAEASNSGFTPMLAQSYDKHADKISFPCFVQPKLDGLRATYVEGVFSSRTQKPFNALGHLAAEMARLQFGEAQFDGELYNHDYKDKFEEIVSAVKREKNDNPNTGLIEYHIYDFPLDVGFGERWKVLQELFSEVSKESKIKLVETIEVWNEAELKAAYERFLEQGYEGAMVRNAEGKYEGRRSYNLQKMKQFEDAEFPIVGMNEGRGALAGHAATFVCEIKDNHGTRQFEAKLKGKNVTPFLKKCFEDHKLWRGKSLTVQFMGMTNRNRVPRHPVGIRIREDE